MAALLTEPQPPAPPPCGRRTARLVAAGPSRRCSQKIHNQLAGAAAASPAARFVLFLDDDVRLHPGTVGLLVAALQRAQPGALLATGYPLDLPPSGPQPGQFWAYCALTYHLPLIVAFSQACAPLRSALRCAPP